MSRRYKPPREFQSANCVGNVPPGAKKIGELYDTDGLDFLGEDMALITIKDFGVDFGWYPEHDPTGSYLVNVYRGDWDNSLSTEELHTADEGTRCIDEWAQKIAADQFTYSRSRLPTDENNGDRRLDSAVLLWTSTLDSRLWTI